jgi:hypothetical protein
VGGTSVREDARILSAGERQAAAAAAAEPLAKLSGCSSSSSSCSLGKREQQEVVQQLQQEQEIRITLELFRQAQQQCRWLRTAAVLRQVTVDAVSHPLQ